VEVHTVCEQQGPVRLWDRVPEATVAKPADFFVGVTDLFSIILPGIALTLIAVHLEDQTGSDLLGLRHSLGEKEKYLAFAVAAYVGGHVVDLLGALVLDSVYDRTYARWKRRPRRTAGGAESTEALGEAPYYDPLFVEARRIAIKVMPWGDGVYQWCRAWIALRSAAAFTEIEREQATSKFFRSMVTLSLLLALLPIWWRGGFRFVAICLLFAGAFFSRYARLRWKAVQQTYRFYIALAYVHEVAGELRARGEEKEEEAWEEEDEEGEEGDEEEDEWATDPNEYFNEEEE